MDLTNMTPTERAAWHRSEADRIEAEERARRPALAAGQVWRYVEGPETNRFWCILVHVRGELLAVSDRGAVLYDFLFGIPKGFELVGSLARDVLRVVPPDPPAPQVAPGPTGAELVGRRCLFSLDGIRWEDYATEGLPPWRECNGYHPDKGWTWGMQGTWFRFAKPYVEGVAP